MPVYRGIEKETEGVTLVSTRHSARQFPLHPYTRKDFLVALEFFRFNAATYPESPNVYDSLGDALEANGELSAALESYSKVEELGEKGGDPNAAAFHVNAERLRAHLGKKVPQK